MPTVTQQELDAIAADLLTLATRVDALTMPGAVVPPVFTESPSGTRITPTSLERITDANLWRWTIAAGKLVCDAAPVVNTSGVVEALYHQQGVYQRNTAGSWYGPATKTTGGPQVPGDPSKPPPVQPPTAGVPPMAAAAGFNTRTLGPRVVMGQNWFPNHVGANITTNADGSVTLAGPWDYNAQITSGNSHSFGTAFGGGGYFEMDFRWVNPFQGGPGVGWPSFWANAAQGRTIPASPPWPAGAAGGGSAIEWDIFEFFNDGWGPTVWDWSVNGSVGTTYSPFNGAWNAQGGAKDNRTAAFSGQRHKIGGLWVPATSTAKGRAEVWLDGVLRPEMTQTWDRFNPATPLPLRNGTTANAIMDHQHMMMLAGSSVANPMTVYSIEIWQRDGSANLPPT